MDQGGAAGERQQQATSADSAEPEYPAATFGPGNPMQYAGPSPVYFPSQRRRSLGYVPTGLVSSRPPVNKNNPLYGLQFSATPIYGGWNPGILFLPCGKPNAALSLLWGSSPALLKTSSCSLVAKGNRITTRSSTRSFTRHLTRLPSLFTRV
jgi:hypothetical protein